MPSYTHHLIGVFQGEGIGPEVTQAALDILDAIQTASDGRQHFEIVEGGPIGEHSIQLYGTPLSGNAIRFCQDIFSRGGAILAGAGGDRFVYDCRRHFGLFHKLNPLIPSQVALKARRIKDEHLKSVDILIVRENIAGIYQGDWGEYLMEDGSKCARQSFSYSESQILEVAEVACRLAEKRNGLLTIVTKPNGIPAISQLWLHCVSSVAARHKIRIQALEIDYATFAMIHNPGEFDVIVTSNLFGDVLSDVGGILLGSRGLCYGGSFSADGAAIYQTNHGAAYDIAGTDSANPVGHLYALAMLLEYSHGLKREAQLIRTAVDAVWSEGWRTADLTEPGCCTIGTREMVKRIADEIQAHAGVSSPV